MIRRKQMISRAVSLLMAMICLGLTFTSCYSDDPAPQKRIRRILVKDFSQVTGPKADRDYTVLLEYDEQNRLIKWTEQYVNHTSVTSLTYSPGEVAMEMDGRALGKYVLNEEGFAVKFERESSKPCIYEYNANGYLIKSDDSNSVNTYEYASGEFVSWARGNASGTIIPSKTKDKMEGPAYYQQLYLYIRGYAGLTQAYMAGLFGKVSQYLPESVTYKNIAGGHETNRQSDFKYEFDKDGYVTRQIEQLTSSGSYAGDTRFEYEPIPN